MPARKKITGLRQYLEASEEFNKKADNLLAGSKARETAIEGLNILLDGFLIQINESTAPDGVKEHSKAVAEHVTNSLIELLNMPDADSFGFGDTVAEVFALVQTSMLQKNSQCLQLFSVLLPTILRISDEGPLSKERTDKIISALSEVSDNMEHISLAYEGFKTMTEATYEKLKAASEKAAEAVVLQASEAI